MSDRLVGGLKHLVPPELVAISAIRACVDCGRDCVFDPANEKFFKSGRFQASCMDCMLQQAQAEHPGEAFGIEARWVRHGVIEDGGS